MLRVRFTVADAQQLVTTIEATRVVWRYRETKGVGVLREVVY